MLRCLSSFVEFKMIDVIFTVLLFIFMKHTHFKMRMTFDNYSGAKYFLTC